MVPPHTVVIPFSVPSEGRGLGIGLAALVHAFARTAAGGVALAQLQARRPDDLPDGPSGPVEAFLSPAAWKEVAGRVDGPAGVGMVVTGAFEPPVDGEGTIQLLAFDARDGRTCAKMDAPVDGEHAGARLVDAFEQLWASLGGELGGLQSIRELGWDALESVLRAERCALHDPSRGGPYDRLAAMLHLGRAIGDAPGARHPVERLSAIALEIASGQTLDPKLAAASVRALEGALTDSSNSVELLEALAALMLRIGQPREAERRMNMAIATAPTRARPYAILGQALRAQGNLDGALAVLQAGRAASKGDPLLSIEQGMVLAARGDLEGAGAAWREVLARDPYNPAAFARLAALALQSHDVGTAQALVDAALAARDAHPDVFRSAVPLALSSETEGLARASRIKRLCERVLDRLPNDAPSLLNMAQALLALGQRVDARTRLDQLERVAPKSAAAADGQVQRLAIDDPRAHTELQSVLRAAQEAPVVNLADVAARARRLAMAHNAWHGWLAVAAAERRRSRLVPARSALEAAFELAPGATLARLEMARVLLAQGNANEALLQAESAVALEGPSPPVLSVLARSLAAAGRSSEAREIGLRVLSMKPDDREVRDMLQKLQQKPRFAWARNLWARRQT
jgi:tetratricopeptide (TPR) repeat protein